MQRLTRFLGVLALTMSLGVASTAIAADPPAVVQFVSLGAAADSDVLLAEAAATRQIFERLGIKATRRYLQATLAGDFSGTLSLMIEYPNLAALADAQAKLANDEEWQKYLDKIQAAGLRVQSNSLWRDVTP